MVGGGELVVGELEVVLKAGSAVCEPGLGRATPLKTATGTRMTVYVSCCSVVERRPAAAVTTAVCAQAGPNKARC
jgi:hypothetical protein